MLEIERKYLIDSVQFKNWLGLNQGVVDHIHQGFLSLDPLVRVRVRVRAVG